uniref:Uncharacterized protein n=1 Tax=Anopheles farauti TaxID=69004 RepID=A0A182QBZ7_9DIPT
MVTRKYKDAQNVTSCVSASEKLLLLRRLPVVAVACLRRWTLRSGRWHLSVGRPLRILWVAGLGRRILALGYGDRCVRLLVVGRMGRIDGGTGRSRGALLLLLLLLLTGYDGSGTARLLLIARDGRLTVLGLLLLLLLLRVGRRVVRTGTTGHYPTGIGGCRVGRGGRGRHGRWRDHTTTGCDGRLLWLLALLLLLLLLLTGEWDQRRSEPAPYRDSPLDTAVAGASDTLPIGRDSHPVGHRVPVDRTVPDLDRQRHRHWPLRPHPDTRGNRGAVVAVAHLDHPGVDTVPVADPVARIRHGAVCSVHQAEALADTHPDPPHYRPHWLHHRQPLHPGTVNHPALAALVHRQHRPARRYVLLRIGQVGQVDEVPVQRHLVRHALASLARELKLLYRLNQARILVQYLLDVHRARRRALSPVWGIASASTTRIRHLLSLLLGEMGDQ